MVEFTLPMNPAPATPDEHIRLLRQQLILAQVRIMELEDMRDELNPRVAELEQLLTDAQRLVDRKSGEAAHHESVRTKLQAQYDHLRHMQHVTNQALEETRTELQTATAQANLLRDEIGRLQLLIAQQAELNRDQQERLGQLQAGLDDTQAESASRLARIHELDAEQRAMKASRSWRWTAWLRSLERLFTSRQP